MVPDSTTVTLTDGTNTRTYTYVAQDTGVGTFDFHSLSDLVAEINNDFGAGGFNTVSAAQNNATGAIGFTALANIDAQDHQLQPGPAQLARLGQRRPGGSGHLVHRPVQPYRGRDGPRDGPPERQWPEPGPGRGQQHCHRRQQGRHGGAPAAPSSSAPARTYGQLLSTINTTLGLTNIDGAEIDGASGAMLVNGDGGLVNELTGLNIRSAARGRDQLQCPL